MLAEKMKQNDLHIKLLFVGLSTIIAFALMLHIGIVESTTIAVVGFVADAVRVSATAMRTVAKTGFGFFVRFVVRVGLCHIAPRRCLVICLPSTRE
jgi:hypothetical protein